MNAKHLIAAAAATFAASAFAAGGGGDNALEPPPPSVAERLDKAHGFIKVANYNAAISELNVAAREESRNAEVHSLLGFSYRMRANPDLPKSFQHYEIALKLDPKHKGAREYLGEAYLMDKKPAEAEKQLGALEGLCGKDCAEYKELAAAIAGYKAKNPQVAAKR